MTGNITKEVHPKKEYRELTNLVWKILLEDDVLDVILINVNRTIHIEYNWLSFRSHMRS